MDKFLRWMRKAFKKQCKYCRHYYDPHHKECDINIGYWNSTDYCTYFERNVKNG